VVLPDELEAAARDLIRSGVHNLNFVTPDHFWPHVRTLCGRLRTAGFDVPFLCNCSGYELPELVEDMATSIDVFMPDFKFADAGLAFECMGDRRYPDIALAALRKMVDAKGALTPWDDTGRITARTGVLVRHLVLPGQVENSLAVLRLLRREFGPLLPLSVMSQFQPTPACRERGVFTRPLPMSEYEQVCDCVEELDFECVYIQPEQGDSDFLPDFTEDEPFQGNVKARGETEAGER